VSVLAKIVAAKRAEIAAGLPSPASGSAPPHTPLDVVARLTRSRSAGAPLRLVTEIKFKSPSAGPLSRVLSAGERAVAYAEAGATMISVLCDRPFFDGSYAGLAEARFALRARGLDVPLLAKEFVIDPSQLVCAAAHGADAVLLIARLVDQATLTALVSRARELGLEPLVEVIDDAELAMALEANARLVGVNARDLDTLEMDAARAGRIVAAIPDGRVALHLSGVRDEAAVAEVSRGRADAALLGEALMRQDDPRPLLRRFVQAAHAQ
jgi:indole-3-glycerol phosphate synthase